MNNEQLFIVAVGNEYFGNIFGGEVVFVSRPSLAYAMPKVAADIFAEMIGNGTNEEIRVIPAY